MKEKIRDWLSIHNVGRQGDRIVAGVSGGADSVCLLCLLTDLRQECGLEVHALHVHHGIRGTEADRDADFVEMLCRQLDVPCRVIYRDVPALAEKAHCSEEEMGRLVRYEAMEAYCQEMDCQWIAVAHNREDQAETILWNLCRGTGLAGLTGIPSVRGRIIRPLLSCSRQEIEAYLTERGQAWREDRTNGEDIYTRNRIRHHVLPLLSGEINSQAVEHIVEAAERLQVISDYLASRSNAERARFHKDERGRSTWLECDFSNCAPALRPEVILAWMKEISGRAADFGAEHLQAVEALFERPVGREVHLPYEMVAKRTYEGVVLFVRLPEGQDAADEEILPKPDVLMEIWDLEEENKQIQTVSQREILFLDGKIVKIPESSCVKWFDYDKIKDTLVIRTRRPGDTLVIHPDGAKKKLKNYWIDRKIPAEERDGKWLLAAGSDVLWIFGDRTGEGCRIDADTRKILKVQITEGGNKNDRKDQHSDQ